MNKILCYIIAGISFYSCAKDKGNYSYGLSEDILITGFQDQYNLISLQDTLSISPQVSSNKDGDFEYTWGVIENLAAGKINTFDTIAHTKDLSFPIKLDANEWILVFQAKNIKTGYSQYKTAKLSVNTVSTRGWYILKDNDKDSDLDVFLTPNDISATSRIDNVLSSSSGNKMPGKAINMSFSSTYQSNVADPAVFTNTRALLVATDNDIRAININNLRTIRDHSSFFINGSQPIEGPTGIFNGNTSIYLFNQGLLYNINTVNQNKGQFGNKIRIDFNNTTYSLSPYFVVRPNMDPILFDNLSATFVTLVAGNGATMTKLNQVQDNDLPVAGSNKTPIYMGYKSTGTASKLQGYAVLQDNSDASNRSLYFLEKDKLNLSLKRVSLETGSKVQGASMFTLLTEDENLLYFVSNNSLYSKNLSNGNEQLQYTVPAGERVTFIKHLKYTLSSDAAYNFNYFIIGTKSGADYKVRMFKKSSGNLESSPSQTLEGNGTAKGILYISPKINTNTFINSY